MKQLINYVPWYVNKLFDHPYARISPLILSGIGRSGTTALRMSLGTHPNLIYNMAENNIVMDILEIGLHNCTYPSRKASMQMSQDRYDKAFRNLLLSVLYPRPPLAITRPKRWMASTDINPRLAEYLRQLFPDVRLVYLVRNGIEVVSSRMLFEGFKDGPFRWQCEVWAKAEGMVRWGVEQNYFYLIRHESLLDRDSISRVLTGLWSWLGLKDNPRCAEALTNSNYHPTTFASEASSAVNDLLHRKSRWEFWSDEQRNMFVEHCSSAMAYLGYEIPWCDRATK
jgi:hypothetical protein